MNQSKICSLTAFFILLIAATVFSQSPLYKPNPYITANSTVRAVVIHDTILYIGGDFAKVTDSLGSYARKGLAAFNLVSGRVTPFTADINLGIVRSIVVDDSMLYAGGTFTKINGIARSKVAAVNPVSGAVISTFSSSTSLINGPVYAVCCLDGKLFVGGNFTRVNDVERSYLAALDAKSGVLDSSFNPSPRDSMDLAGKMSGGVTALEVHPANSARPGILFVGGNFQTIDGIPDGRFMVALHSDGTPGPAFAADLYFPVLDIYCKDTILYAGIGGFGNQPAAYNIASSESYTELWKGFIVQGDVQAITCSDSGFVFFSFHQGLFDTTDFYRCAVINAKTGLLYDTLPSMNTFFGVWALDAKKDILVAGGAFTSLGGRAQKHLAVCKVPHYPVLAIPEKVILSDPPDSTMVTPLYPKLKWKFVPYAESYEVQVATDSLFGNCIATYEKISNYAKRCPELTYGSGYFWRVRAANGQGTGAWSSTWRFFTEAAEVDTPEAVRPPDGATDKPVSFDSWHRGTGSISYCIAKRSDVVVTLYNLKGTIVWQCKARNVAPGYHTKNLRTGALSAGAYIVSIDAGDFRKRAGVAFVKQ